MDKIKVLSELNEMKELKERPNVTFFGGARFKPGDAYYDLTKIMANGLANRGFNIITGGGPGIMEAANKGAFEREERQYWI